MHIKPPARRGAGFGKATIRICRTARNDHEPDPEDTPDAKWMRTAHRVESERQRMRYCRHDQDRRSFAALSRSALAWHSLTHSAASYPGLIENLGAARFLLQAAACAVCASNSV
jgi:hypothetical protein